MSTEDLIQAIFVGICLYAAILHLILGLRSEPRDRVHLSFSVVSLLYGIYSLGLFFLYTAFDTGSLTRYVFHDKWGIAANYLAYASLFWFIAIYTRAKLHFMLWILSSLYISIALSNFILPYTWVYSDIELTSVFPPNITLSPWYPFETVATLILVTAYATYQAFRLHRSGERDAARALGIAVWIYAATYAFDTAIEYGLIDSVLLQQYGFLTFIVIMSLRLTGQVVEAEKQVRQLNIDLDHRVAKRTAELSRANQDLVRARDAAQAANRAKSIFLANMSHELRTPLNAILGHAQIMSRDRSLTPEQHHGVKAVNRSGDHLLTLINSVLEMSKIEAGEAVLNPSSFNIEALISDMEIMFGERLREKNLEFVIEKDPDIISSIEADRGKISQILINLLSNAIRYTQNGVITLRVAMAGASGEPRDLIFEVEDTGQGIAPEDQERIFVPFAQIDIGSPQRAGTGLGLAIARQYARMMDGELTVEGRVGQGSIFRFMIPAVQAKLAPRETGLTPLQQIVGIAGERRQFRVLVVDDEPSNREVLIRMLSPVGFETREATDGQEAITAFMSWSPNLVLMDIRMPDVDGIEAIKAIKATDDGRTTPIIGVSASVFEDDKATVLDSGADDFVTKPVQEADLFEKIGRCLKIGYLFDNGRPPVAAPSEIHLLTRECMAELPKDLVEEMRAAVQGGYMEHMAELAKRAAVIQPQLSEQLLKIIDDYNYETLSRLFLEDGEDK